jgi:FlaA1/EpsC-like NDP-sugar epimerase
MLITGGAGAFGQAFVKHLLDWDYCERICIYSRDEYKQSLMKELFNDDRLRFFIGDARDKERLTRAMRGVSTVIHAAALKRIEVGKYNPGEMVKTNVLGTMNVIEASQDARSVRKVVYLSSDKAFQPVSAYGQSKALGESLILAANDQVGPEGPSFAVTRYGNVAGSTGSVIPKWRSATGRVQITDPDCTRFWMYMDHAVSLVMQAVTGSQEIYIPSLPAFRLGDLAEAMGLEYDVIGLPAHEKIHEGMDVANTSDMARRMSVDELKYALERV